MGRAGPECARGLYSSFLEYQILPRSVLWGGHGIFLQLVKGGAVGSIVHHRFDYGILTRIKSGFPSSSAISSVANSRCELRVHRSASEAFLRPLVLVSQGHLKSRQTLCDPLGGSHCSCVLTKQVSRCALVFRINAAYSIFISESRPFMSIGPRLSALGTP